MAYLSNGKRIPEFLIVHLPGQSSERLIIPDSFVTSCNRWLPKHAVLSNYIGSSWHVTLGCIDGRVFFLNGWQKFFKDNSIEYGDFLIFRYDGQRGFSVKILGTSGCEKLESNAKRTSYMNEVKLEGGEEEKEKEEETKENDNEDYDDHDHDSDNNDDSNGDNNDDSNDSDYIDEEEENSTEEEAIKKSRAGKQSGGSIGGSKTRAAVNVEGGSKRINVVNIEEEEEESTIRKSRVRKQSGGNNGGSKKWTAVKVEGGSKRTNTINIEEEEEEEEDESTIKTGRAQKRGGGNTGGSKKWTAVKVEGGSKRTNTVNIEEEEEEEEEDESTIKTGRAQKRSGGNTGGYKKRVFVRIEEEIEEEEEQSRDWENSDENNGISVKMLADKIGRGSTRTCDFPLEEVDVSKYIQPRNPHFIAKLRAGPKRNILPIPSKVINFWQLKLPNLVFFQNNRGRQWRGNVFSWKDGRFWISGWNDFCLGNRVSPNDCCICEFLPRNIRGEDIINVHIVPKTGSRS